MGIATAGFCAKELVVAQESLESWDGDSDVSILNSRQVGKVDHIYSAEFCQVAKVETRLVVISQSYLYYRRLYYGILLFLSLCVKIY